MGFFYSSFPQRAIASSCNWKFEFTSLDATKETLLGIRIHGSVVIRHSSFVIYRSPVSPSLIT
jgi:hypothetical protein